MSVGVVVAAVALFLGCVSRASHADAVYWSDIHNGAIYRSSGPGAPHKLIVPDAGRPWGITIDPVRRHLYWSDMNPDTAPKIMRSDLDGSNRTVVLAEAPISGGGTQFVQGIALDMVNDYVYYTEGNTRTIRRVRTDGTGDEVVVRGRLNGPVDVKLDVANGHMYWTQIISTHSEIYRAKLDGSEQELLFTDQGFYYDLAIAPGRKHLGSDYGGEHLYFADQHPNYHAVRRIGIEGGPSADVVAHIDGLEPSGLEIDPDGRWIYFSRRDQPGIWRTSFDGRQLQEVVNPDHFPANAYTIDFTLEHTAFFAAGIQVPEPALGTSVVTLAALAAARRRVRL